MNTIKQSAGGSGYEEILKKIYLKYIYKGDEDSLKVVNEYVINLIDSANNIDDLNAIENILNDLVYKKKISIEEYDYLYEELSKKRNEF